MKVTLDSDNGDRWTLDGDGPDVCQALRVMLPRGLFDQGAEPFDEAELATAGARVARTARPGKSAGGGGRKRWGAAEDAELSLRVGAGETISGAAKAMGWSHPPASAAAKRLGLKAA